MMRCLTSQKSQWLWLSCCGVLSTPADAQTDLPKDTIVVTGALPSTAGSPAYGAITLDRADLAQDPSGRLENALTGLAGVQQFRRSDSRSANPSAQGLSLRALGGNASSRALVLLDGVPQADPFFGSVPFNRLDAEPLRSARITRGGGVGAFGAGALAGTVELLSSTGRSLPNLDAHVLVGSANAREAALLVAPRLAAGIVRFNGLWRKGDGFHTTPEDIRGSGDVRARYRDWVLSFGASVPVGANGLIEARMALSDDQRTLRFRGADSSTGSQDASLRYLSGGSWQVEAIAYLQRRDFSNIVVSATSLRPVLDQYRTPSTGGGAKLEMRPPALGEHALRLGFDTRLASGSAHEAALNAASGQVTARRIAGGAQALVGFFIEDDWTLGDVVLTAGGRIDHWRQTDGQFVERNGTGQMVLEQNFPRRTGWESSARAGLLWRAVPGVNLRVASYTGFRLPTLNELYRSFTLFPVTTRANPALEPERLRGAELGVDLTPVRGLQFGVTAFANRLESAIANVTMGTNMRQRANVDAILARGIELAGRIERGAVSLSGSWARSNSRVRSANVAPQLDGRRPAQSPQHSATLSLAWAPRMAGSLSVTGHYVGPQFEDDLGVDRLPGALTVGLSGAWPIVKGLSVIGRIENIFDTQVITRKVGASTDVGAPRTIWLGLRFSAARGRAD
jgi:outer membrane receptor protein involved in Fe transport